MAPDLDVEPNDRAASDAAPEWVVFACGEHRFGFPLARVREILPALPFTRLPGCGPEVCGLVGVRGNVFTVLDFGVVLGLAPAADAADHRLILLAGERRVALAVEAVVAVTRAAAEASLGADALRALDVGRDDLLGIGALDDQPFLAVDPERVAGRLLS